MINIFAKAMVFSIAGCMVVGNLFGDFIKAGVKQFIQIENKKGLVLEIHPLSILHGDNDRSWVCFRIKDSRRWHLYPLSDLALSSRATLLSVSEEGYLLVADGVTGRDLDFLEEYLRSEPRERLLLEYRELNRRENELNRETERLREQTYRLQLQLAQVAEPTVRERLLPAFQLSLRARDRSAKQLSLVRVERERLRSVMDRLNRLAVLESNP